MNTLIVGVGALGGLVAARLRERRRAVPLSAGRGGGAPRGGRLSVTGVGGPARVDAPAVAALEAYAAGDAFELIVLATKARDALEVGPRLPRLLAPGGALLPIQNGGVSQLLADRLGEVVLGGLSNLGATLLAPGEVEQRNAGHLVVGELTGGVSPRAERVGAWLGRAVEVRVTPNLAGAVWSKLLLNCSVTTLGAVAGRTMREYLAAPGGRALFDRAYDEALAVALASGARPERMLVEPVPPAPGPAREAWLDQVLAAYGDLKPSMLQDLERGRATEVDVVNGHVVDVGRRLGAPTPVNAAIVEAVRALERGDLAPGPALLPRVLARAGACDARESSTF
ncbi:MAG: 2-dehydropantoate 2-reductase [Planctomycetes bacterium]|nr:2-dehydropantoate 2-reductase [Planctomycetota bacterium]